MHFSLPKYIAATRPIFIWPVIRYYVAYFGAAILLLSSLSLLLPILRGGAASVPREVHHSLTFASITVEFSLAWWIPFLCTALAAVGMIFASRLEFGIWGQVYENYLSKAAAQLAGADYASFGIRDNLINRAARARAMTLRRIALIFLDGLKLTGLLIVLCFFEPMAVLIALSVFAALFLSFSRLTWQLGSSNNGNADGIKAMAEHRVRLSNARHVASAVMPLTTGAILFLSQLDSQWIEFDLVNLIIITFLVSASSTSAGTIHQTLLHMRRVPIEMLEPWPPLAAENSDVFVRALVAANDAAMSGADLDEPSE